MHFGIFPKKSQNLFFILIKLSQTSNILLIFIRIKKWILSQKPHFISTGEL